MSTRIRRPVMRVLADRPPHPQPWPGKRTGTTPGRATPAWPGKRSRSQALRAGPARPKVGG